MSGLEWAFQAQCPVTAFVIHLRLTQLLLAPFGEVTTPNAVMLLVTCSCRPAHFSPW